MSKRGSIYNTACGALLASTAINYVSKSVSEDPFSYTEDRYPAVRIFDGAETKERFCYPATTDQLDMRSELELDFTAYARNFDKSTTGLNDSLYDLLSKVESVVVTDSTLLTYVMDITLDSARTDMGYSEGIGWVSGTFRAVYLYNHTSP